MKWSELDQTRCSIARSLAVVGDRWTLMILRNAFMRTRRFEEFQAQLGITRHLLADRLTKLVTTGVLEKRLYQERPKRHEYRLTEAGRDLYPLLLGLAAWGDKWRGDDNGPPLVYRHNRCGQLFRPVTVCSECGEPVDPYEVTPLAGAGMA